jgi:hypothetical protein
MLRIGVFPSRHGVSAFEVACILRLPSSFLISHVQPEPNVVIAACANCSFIASIEPKEASIAFERASLGVVSLLGVSIFQKRL